MYEFEEEELEEATEGRQDKEKKANNSAPKLNLSMLADADILDNK